MRYVAASVLAGILAISPTLTASDAATDLATARKFIAEKQYKKAVPLLDSAKSAVASLPTDQQDDALGAVHFYSALAQFGLKNQERTRQHLEDFFGVTPYARIDADRYPRGFVDAFNNLSEQINKGVVTFERFYPGFDDTAAATGPARVANEESWGDSPALRLLGSRAEKKEWDSVVSVPDRIEFIRSFWQRRDPTPETDRNEAREVFDRRVAFADHVFPAEGERGALTDRGRIFVILGPPSMIQRRALTNRDNVELIHDFLDGTMELWAYSSKQLPMDIPKSAVQYRFVTQKGIGVGVLQHSEEPYATKVLAGAGEASIVRR
jgi:GWxTD domain-containing protein